MAPGNTAKNSKNQQQQQILLKFNIRTNEIIFPPANSLGTNRGGGGKTYMYWTVTQIKVLVDGLNNNKDTTGQ